MSNNESTPQKPAFPEHFGGRQREDYELAMDLIYCANEISNERASAARRIAEIYDLASTRLFQLGTATTRGRDEEFIVANKQFEHLVRVAGALMPLEVTFVDSNG